MLGTAVAAPLYGDTVFRYEGSIRSDRPFTSVTPVRVDSWDVLDVGENGMETAYLCRVVNHGQDGIDFQFPEGARVCVDPGTSDTPVWFGAGRRPVDGPLDLTTLEPCETPE